MQIPKRFGRNIASSYLLTAVVGVIALVTTPILANGLGKEAFGVWALISSFILYFKLLEFGVGKVIPRYVAEYGVRGSGEQLGRVISTATALLTLAAAASCAAALGLALAFPALFDVDPSLGQAASIAVGLVLLDISVSIAADAFGWTLIGLQRFDVVNLTLIAVLTAQAVAWVVVLELGGGLVALAAASLVISLLGQLARYAIARRLLPGIVVAPRQLFDRTLVRPFMQQSAWLAMTDLAAVIAFRTDVIVVAIVVGVPAAGIYAVGQKLTLALEQLIQPTTKTFFPHAADLAAREDAAGLRRSLVLTTRMSLLVAVPLALVLSVLSGRIIDAWVGTEFHEAASVIVFLAWATVVVAATRGGLLMLQGIGRPRGAALVLGTEAVLNIVLSIVLASSMGADGVALGTLLASALGALVFIPYLCRTFELPLWAFAAPLLRGHVPSAAVTLLVGWAVTRAPLASVPAVVVAGAAMLLTYLAVFTVVGVDAAERRWLRSAIRSRLG